MESVEFPIHTIIQSLNNGHFTSSFPIWMPFISSCLIALASISSTMLNKSGKSEHPCLFPDLNGNAFTMEWGLTVGEVR